MLYEHKGIKASIVPFDGKGDDLLMVRKSRHKTLGCIIRSTRRRLGEPITKYTPRAYVEGHSVSGSPMKTLKGAFNWIAERIQEPLTAVQGVEEEKND